MIIAQVETPIRVEQTGTAVVSTLDGVTTALVAFVLVGLIFPHVIKKQREFYLIVAAVMVLVLVHALTLMIRSPGFTVFAGVLTGIVQMAGIAMSVMSTGGLGAKQLAGELSRSYEVMRRGEESKEVIIPLEGTRKKQDEQERVVYTIDTPTPMPTPGAVKPPGPAKPPTSDSPIPLDD